MNFILKSNTNRNIFTLLISLLISLNTYSQISSNGSGGGTWSLNSTWSGNTKPVNSNDVIIKANDEVTITSATTVNNLTIESDGQLNISGSSALTVNGNLTINGMVVSSSNITLAGNLNVTGLLLFGGSSISLTMSTAGTSLTGNGQISGGVLTIDNDISLLSTSSLNVSSIAISNRKTLTNNGVINVLGNITGRGTFLNNSNSNLLIQGSISTDLTATAANNSVTFDGNSAQDLPKFDFYNLNLSGTSVKTTTGDITINGDLTIQSSASLTSSNNITLVGNLTVLSTANKPLNLSSKTFTINGTSLLAGNGPFDFYKLTINSGKSLRSISSGKTSISGSFNNNGILNVTGDLTITGTVSKAGTILFTGSRADQIFTSTDAGNITVNKASGDLLLGSGLTVTNGMITLTNGNLNLNSFTLNLSSSTVVEQNNNSVIGAGNVIESFTYNNSNTSYVFGNGVSISNCGNCKNVTVSRGTLTQGALNKSIGRYYDVSVPSPSASFSASLTFKYLDSETNGQKETNFKFYKSTDGGLTWTGISPTAIDTINNVISLSGITSFSRWTVSNSQTNPLPVDFINLNAKRDNNLVTISWTTAMEMNNEYFTIEKSIDGTHFEAIASVDSKGNSRTHTQYSYSIVNEIERNAIFRIKQHDINGNVENSKLFALSNDENELYNSSFEVFPNPSTNDDIFLRYSVNASDTYQIKIFDINQVCHYTEELDLEGNGVSKLYFIESNRLKPGIYYINLRSSTENKTLKLIIN